MTRRAFLEALASSVATSFIGLASPGFTNTTNWLASFCPIPTNVLDICFRSTDAAECEAFMIALADSKDKNLGEAAWDICAKNKSPHTLESIGHLNIKHVVWSNETIFADVENGWNVFYKTYPGSPGIINLSRPGFSNDGSTAIIFMANVRGGLAGEMRFRVITGVRH